MDVLARIFSSCSGFASRFAFRGVSMYQGQDGIYVNLIICPSCLRQHRPSRLVGISDTNCAAMRTAISRTGPAAADTNAGQGAVAAPAFIKESEQAVARYNALPVGAVNFYEWPTIRALSQNS
jgi:hypothetical protein